MNFITVPLLSLVLTASASYANQDKDRLTITQGVGPLSAPGCLPGPISVSGHSAFVVITGKAGEIVVPVFGATRVGRGKAIAGGHEGFFGNQALADPNNAKFAMNSLQWLAGKSSGKLRIGLLNMPALRQMIESSGGVAEILKPDDIPSKLTRYDAICLTQEALDRFPAKQNAVVNYLKGGGGVLIAGPAWGWLYGAGGLSLAADHTGNAILRPFGLGFADGGLDGPFSVEGASNPLLNADQAMATLKAGNLSAKDTKLALKPIEALLTILPADDRSYIPRIRALAKQESATDGPTLKNPITDAMPFARLGAMLFSRSSKALPASQIKAHPSASAFPGPVPSETPRVSLKASIDTRITQWHGTGLYAAPGELVTVEIPANAAKAGLGVRIGCHTDTLWGLDKWQRFPEISTYKELSSAKTVVANPFGGTVYIDVPEKSNLGTIEVKITNAVLQPRFVKGETSLEDWRKEIRMRNAPWAEMEGDLVILSVPSSSVRDVDDPEALMAYWDRVMEACYALYAAPKRNRPERYCVDRQISLGYMHSGYPIMTFEDVAKTFCNLSKLSVKGEHLWGFYHEMGHNFQEGAWTFEGTVEVTNNLFSVYGQETVVGLRPEEHGIAISALKEPETTNRLKKYLADGAKFSEWQDNPFLALTMYLQIRKAFGWEPITKVIASYRTGSQPRSEMDKHDEWMVRLSKAVGKDLGPFFSAWGVPVSEGARKSVSNLPKWMPEDWPVK